MSEQITLEGPVCPVPIQQRGQVIMGHGSGGKLSQDLISGLFLPPFDNPILRAGDDAGLVEVGPNGRLAISTDSHVVWPLFFPGGDIGRLAVCGTVNDVAMMGARPLYLTAGFILEEGLELGLLQQIVSSMCAAAFEAKVKIIAGDTKVVERGKADGLYINTSGVGLVQEGTLIGGAQARPGDAIILSGPIGDHGIAVLSARGDLGLQADVESDVAPRNHLVEAMLATGLASRSRRGNLVDRFRGRLMFPIYDVRGDAVGFGARQLDGDPPKYLNSPETPVYHKSRLLYGLNWAKSDIVRADESVVVEGYTDVIAMHLAGLPIAVATCGTALGEDHLDLLRRWTNDQSQQAFTEIVRRHSGMVYAACLRQLNDAGLAEDARGAGTAPHRQHRRQARDHR